MKHVLSLFIILFGLSSFSQEIQFTDTEKAWIKAHPVIHFGYEPHWEPYEIYKNGEYGGIVGDYVKILSKKTGIKMIPIPNLTWKKSMQGLLDGNIMIVPSFVNTRKRYKNFKLTDPYIKDPIVIVGTKKSDYFSTLKDLKGKTIALPIDYYTNTLIKNHFPSIKIKNYPTIQACFEALITNKVDAFVGNLNVISYYRNNFGFDDLKIVGVTPFKKNGVCLAVNPEWTTFRDIANKVFKHVSPKESHDIRERWIGVNRFAYLHSPFFKWTIALFSFIVILLLFIFLRNRALKKGIVKGRKIEKDLHEQLSASARETKEKQAMLREIHHRIKNNLQMVSSMLNLQSNSTKSEDCHKALKDASNRVNSIALIHNKIYETDTIKYVNLKDYIISLFNSIKENYNGAHPVEIEIHTEEIDVQMKTVIPIALILNELLTNSLNYAFSSQVEPRIDVEIISHPKSKGVDLIYSDNGTWVENEKSDHFGSSLIEVFTEQIDGSFEIFKKEGETTYKFHFKNMDFSV